MACKEQFSYFYLRKQDVSTINEMFEFIDVLSTSNAELCFIQLSDARLPDGL